MPRTKMIPQNRMVGHMKFLIGANKVKPVADVVARLRGQQATPANSRALRLKTPNENTSPGFRYCVPSGNS